MGVARKIGITFDPHRLDYELAIEALSADDLSERFGVPRRTVVGARHGSAMSADHGAVDRGRAQAKSGRSRLRRAHNEADQRRRLMSKGEGPAGAPHHRSQIQPTRVYQPMDGDFGGDSRRSLYPAATAGQSRSTAIPIRRQASCATSQTTCAGSSRGARHDRDDAATVATSLSELEAIIDRGKQTFVEVGNALTEIRERKLYREAGYATFEDYCQQRHGFSASRGRQLIAAAATVTAVTLSGGTAPATEREARALAAAQRAYDAEAGVETTDRSVVLLDEYDDARKVVADLAAKVGLVDVADAVDQAVEDAILEIAARELCRTGSCPLPPLFWWEWTYPNTHKGKKQGTRNATRDASNRLVIWQIEVEIHAGRFLTWCKGAGINFWAKPSKGESVFHSVCTFHARRDRQKPESWRSSLPSVAPMLSTPLPFGKSPLVHVAAERTHRIEGRGVGMIRYTSRFRCPICGGCDFLISEVPVSVAQGLSATLRTGHAAPVPSTPAPSSPTRGRRRRRTRTS